MLSRVVEILNNDGITINEQQLLDAFVQAREELARENLSDRLDKLVEQGRLSQEQADEIKEWWSQRPECLGPGLGLFGQGPNLEGGLKWGKGRFPWAPKLHRAPILPQEPIPTPLE